MRLSHFKVQLVIRLTVLFVALLLLAFGIADGIRASLLVVIGVIIAIMVISLIRYINYTNRELESFLSGLRFGDFQQNYTIAHLGPTFQGLQTSLQVTVDKFKTLRARKEQEAIYFRALVQHIPIPFFIVHSDQRIEILNHATRRTFNVADIAHADQLGEFGAGFQRDVLQIQPGEQLLTTIELAGTEDHYLMTATQLAMNANVHKLVSLQSVQSQIDATELATWQNLLRVTSHEILNSLAPVSSCAQTAGALVEDALESEIDDPHLEEDLQDIRDSLATVLRRSQGLTRFIQSYRQLSRLPPPDRQPIRVQEYFGRLQSLVSADLARNRITLSFRCDPPSLVLVADEGMLDQALINLVRNAANALEDTDHGQIDVRAFTDARQRTVIEVEDNGPGIPEEMAEQVFTPFFTTRDQGSGVGLALVRYIMLSHGGKAICERGENGGARFRLVF